MKNKFIVTTLLLSASLFANAQSGKNPVEPTKSLSTEEVNRSSGVANTMINGKPYSQYKAEQDALKLSSKVATTPHFNTSNTGLVNAVPETKTQVTPVNRTTPENGVNVETPVVESKNKLIANSNKSVTVQDTKPNTEKVVAVPVVTIAKDGPEVTEMKTTPVPVPAQNDKPKSN